MQYANELFFIVAATILWGLAVGGKSLIQLNKIIQPEGYWFVAFNLFSLWLYLLCLCINSPYRSVNTSKYFSSGWLHLFSILLPLS